MYIFEITIYNWTESNELNANKFYKTQGKEGVILYK